MRVRHVILLAAVAALAAPAVAPAALAAEPLDPAAGAALVKAGPGFARPAAPLPSAAPLRGAALHRLLPASPALAGRSSLAPRFVPLGVLMAGSATLDGHVYDFSGAPASATVEWAATVDGSVVGGTSSTTPEGLYRFTGVPPATGDGETWALRDDGSSWSWLGRVGAAWPDAATTTYDFTPGQVRAAFNRGGRWGSHPDWEELWLTGTDDAGGAVVSGSNFPFTAQSGSYDQATAYFFMDEGMELPLTLRVAAGERTAAYGGWSDSVGMLIYADAQHGWVATAQGWKRTTDGGATWSDLPAGPYAVDVDFVDALHGWAATAYGDVMATDDGGQSWTDQPAPDVPTWQDIDFCDSQHGIVAWGNAVGMTDDGGTTWTTIPFNDDYLLAAYRLDAQHAWVAGQYGRIHATADGGQTWQTWSGTSEVTSSLEFVDAANGWAAGYGSLLSTTDGGATWQTIPIAGSGYTRVDFVDAQHGMVSGDQGTIVTADGGVTWNASSAVSPTSWVTMVDAQHAWGLRQGSIVGTSDGGQTWEQPLVTVDEAQANRIWVSSPYRASGKPGSTVKIRLENFEVGWKSRIWGYPSWPGSAKPRAFTGYTAKDLSLQTVTRTLPRTVKPGYGYYFAFEHTTGPLYLRTPFQVCTLNATATSVRKGRSIRFTGTIPIEGHKGSTPGVRSKVYFWVHKGRASVPATMDPRRKGWYYVGYVKTDGYGRFRTPLLEPQVDLTMIAQYPGDTWYWGAYTPVRPIDVR